MAIKLDHTGSSFRLKTAASTGTVSGFKFPSSGALSNLLSISTIDTSGIATLAFVAAPVGLPSGGSTGQLLRKSSTGYEWASAIPAGGSTGQVLTKNSASDYDLAWTTATSGGGGIGGALDFGSITQSSAAPIDLGSVADSLSTSPLTLALTV